MVRFWFLMCLSIIAFGGCSISCSYKGRPPARPDYGINQLSFVEYMRARTVIVHVKSVCRGYWGTRSDNSHGTGVVLSSAPGRSYIITARHVVTEPGKCKYKVLVGKVSEDNKVGRLYPSTVLVKSGLDADLVLLSVPTNFKVSTRFVKTIRIGTRAHGLGFPTVLMSKEKTFWVYTDGSISTKGIKNGKGKADYIAFTAKIYFGNSGGGIWTDSGELVSLATDIFYNTRVAYSTGYGPSVRCMERFLKTNGFGYLLRRMEK